MDPWDVLTDDQILAKARREFGSASMNPFYTNPDRTLRAGSLYLAALNPGGATSIPSQVREMPLDHPQRAADREDWCKPLDEHWGTNYQNNVIDLARRVLPGGVESLRGAFCTEALFMRGKVLDKKVDGEGLWEVCRPWHLGWLKVVRPGAILCLGNAESRSPYAWLGTLLDGFREVERFVAYSTFAAKVGDGRCDGRAVTLIGMPHPAHWSPSAERSRAGIEKVRDLLHAKLGDPA